MRVPQARASHTPRQFRFQKIDSIGINGEEAGGKRHGVKPRSPKNREAAGQLSSLPAPMPARSLTA